MSVGSRQSRRRRRARSKQAQRRRSANAVLFEIVGSVHASARKVEWPVLFYAMLATLVGVVVSLLTGAFVLAAGLFVSSVVLCVALWAMELR
jgi:uncharacterized membrane protein YfcA